MAAQANSQNGWMVLVMVPAAITDGSTPKYWNAHAVHYHKVDGSTCGYSDTLWAHGRRLMQWNNITSNFLRTGIVFTLHCLPLLRTYSRFCSHW